MNNKVKIILSVIGLYLMFVVVGIVMVIGPNPAFELNYFNVLGAFPIYATIFGTFGVLVMIYCYKKKWIG